MIMIDEEANNYKIDLCAHCRECEKGNCSHTDDAIFGFKDGYKKGLVEGRKLGKEEQWLATEKAQKKTSARIKELEKENAELKDDLILKLKAQIEKMKNVGNCKKSMTCAKWNEKQTMLGCMKFCKNCKEWELAE